MTPYKIAPSILSADFGRLAEEVRAAERELACVYLGAQTHARGFYEGLGYSAYGEEFDDAGLPHRHMWRPLDHLGAAGMTGAAGDLVPGDD